LQKNHYNKITVSLQRKETMHEMSINFFKHTIQKMIKISLYEREAVTDVHKFLINLNSDN